MAEQPLPCAGGFDDGMTTGGDEDDGVTTGGSDDGVTTGGEHVPVLRQGVWQI